MIDSLGGVTSQLVGLSLDMSLLRHQVISNNIANASTAGFKAERLDFRTYMSGFINQAMLDQAGDGLLNSVAIMKDDVKNNGVKTHTTEKAVELDNEMIELTENVLHYRALLEANSKRGDLLKMAIKEGRG